VHNANGRGFGQEVRSNSKPSTKRTRTLAVQIPVRGIYLARIPDLTTTENLGDALNVFIDAGLRAMMTGRRPIPNG
jgi:hypothetical protein